jgi:single-strand DNA-binding protein
MSVNKVILVGRLGRDPESRFTASGQPVCNFSLATDRSYKDRNGQTQKQTEWHKIVVWGKLAEICQKYLKKGSQIFVEGRIQSRQWDDQQGQKRTAFEIVANEMRMLGSRADAGMSQSGGAHAPQTGAAESAAADEPHAAPDDTAPEVSDEDIPF